MRNSLITQTFMCWRIFICFLTIYSATMTCKGESSDCLSWFWQWCTWSALFVQGGKWNKNDLSLNKHIIYYIIKFGVTPPTPPRPMSSWLFKFQCVRQLTLKKDSVIYASALCTFQIIRCRCMRTLTVIRSLCLLTWFVRL